MPSILRSSVGRPRGEVELLVELLRGTARCRRASAAARRAGRGNRARARARTRRSRSAPPPPATAAGSRRACCTRGAATRASRTISAPVPNGRKSVLCGSRMIESASLMPRIASRPRSVSMKNAPYAPSTWNQSDSARASRASAVEIVDGAGGRRARAAAEHERREAVGAIARDRIGDQHRRARGTARRSESRGCSRPEIRPGSPPSETRDASGRRSRAWRVRNRRRGRARRAAMIAVRLASEPPLVSTPPLPVADIRRSRRTSARRSPRAAPAAAPPRRRRRSG